MKWVRSHWLEITSVVTVIAIVATLGIGINLRQVNHVPKVTITVGTKALAAGQADYTCTGINDNVTIQLALNALPASGGELFLYGGTYNFAALATVTRAIANVSVVGVGKGAYLTGDGVTPEFTAGGNGWTFSNIRTDAGGIAMGATTGWLWSNVTIASQLYAVRTVDSTSLPTGRGETLFVAASNALTIEKSQADYICDGTADNVEIQAAIDALPNIGGTVLLSTGLFTISAALKPHTTANSTTYLTGSGSGYYGNIGITTIKIANGANCNAIQNVDNVSDRVLGVSGIYFNGNKANEASGHGLVLNNHLDVGGHLTGGLFDVVIYNFKQNGIDGSAGYPTFLAGQWVSVNTNDGYGVYATGGEGWHLKMPFWIYSNALDNLHGEAIGNSELEFAVETGAHGGAYLSGTGDSTISIHGLGNNWYLASLGDNHGCTFNILGKDNANDWTGTGVAANKRGQVIIFNGEYSNTYNMEIQPDGTPANTDALVIDGGSDLIINGLVESNRYAVIFPSPQQMTDIKINALLKGTTAKYNLPSGGYISSDRVSFGGYQTPNSAGGFYGNYVVGRYYFSPYASTPGLSGNEAMVAEQMWAIPFFVEKTVTIDRLAISITGAGAGGKIVRLGMYIDSGTMAFTGSPLLVDGGTVPADGATGLKTVTVSNTLYSGQHYWLVAVSDGTPTISFGSNVISLLGSTDGINGNSEYYVNASASSGGLPLTAPATSGTVGKIHGGSIRIASQVN